MADGDEEKPRVGRPFEKGDPRINRAGRPHTSAEVREALAAQTLPSIQFLADTRDDPDAPLQLRAWCADRLLGKTVPNAERLELPGGSAADAPGVLNARAALAARLAKHLTAGGPVVDGTVVEGGGGAAPGAEGPGPGAPPKQPGSE